MVCAAGQFHSALFAVQWRSGYARCRWSTPTPAQGRRVRHISRGPASTANHRYREQWSGGEGYPPTHWPYLGLESHPDG
eukprot:10797219-Ditylum_brightwellii.AAC.2